MSKRFALRVLLLVAAVVLAACGGASPAGIEPAGSETCDASAQLLQEVLGKEPTTAEVPFEDYIRQETGTGCQATVTGTGAEFGGDESLDPATLWNAMEAGGWTRETNYEAGGPTGTISGWTKGDELCLLSAGWQPSAEVSCPSDQPISACDVKPEQQIWTITLNCAAVPD